MNRYECASRADELSESFERAHAEKDLVKMEEIVRCYDALKEHVDTMIHRPYRPLEEFVDAVNEILVPYTNEIVLERCKKNKELHNHFRWQCDYLKVMHEASITHMELFQLLVTQGHYGTSMQFVLLPFYDYALRRVNAWLLRHGCEKQIKCGFLNQPWKGEKLSILNYKDPDDSDSTNSDN